MNDSITKKDLFEVVTILQKDLRENFATKKDLLDVVTVIQNDLKENFVTKKDLTEILDQKLGSFKDKINKRFDEERVITGQKFEEVGGSFKEVIRMMSDGFEDLQNSIDKLEGNHDRRITTVEDRVRVIKNVIEKDLKTKVAW